VTHIKGRNTKRRNTQQRHTHTLVTALRATRVCDSAVRVRLRPLLFFFCVHSVATAAGGPTGTADDSEGAAALPADAACDDEGAGAGAAG